jgi:hypothetical protein
LTLIFAIADEPLHADMFEGSRARMCRVGPYGAARAFLQERATGRASA